MAFHSTLLNRDKLGLASLLSLPSKWIGDRRAVQDISSASVSQWQLFSREQYCLYSWIYRKGGKKKKRRNNISLCNASVALSWLVLRIHVWDISYRKCLFCLPRTGKGRETSILKKVCKVPIYVHLTAHNVWNRYWVPPYLLHLTNLGKSTSAYNRFKINWH